MNKVVHLFMRTLNLYVMQRKLNLIEQDLKAWIDYLKSDQQIQSVPKDHWLMLPELCSLLRCSENTLYRKFRTGELKYSKPSAVMVWLSDVAAYVVKKESH